ncbi:NUDIX hydrolase [Herbiconiux sp. SYSU D00978]|uniref:NUDIX hydrolase n=1 Tax=Herbiconiux sp. SYSU D00978 TaxID=2812562 RepID=UPI001A963F13|nr:NUDIX domain-containing protein [Herbiconiux sp. SYSU D00978]
MSSLPPVQAAGALCWRVVDGRVRVLVVHRATHGDVSLPKGKLDRGEMLPTAAAREVREETGIAAALGAPLGTVRYTLPGGRGKVVHYWSAEVTDEQVAKAKFKPNHEIEALEWLSVRAAVKKVTYTHDAELLELFASRLEAGIARTFPLVLLRHGKATPRGDWRGTDASRPLLPRGREQARAVAPAIAAWAPRKLVSSPAARCVETVAPLAKLLRRGISEVPDISQDAWEDGTADVAAVIDRRLAKGKGAVLCSHGPVLPELVRELAQRTGEPLTAELRRAAALAPGEFTVVHVPKERASSGIVATETHTPAVV